MSIIVVFNGPPGCGKDTLANGLANMWGPSATRLSVAAPIKSAIKALFGLSDEEIEAIESDRILKETPSDVFCGKSYREACISLSEDWARPAFGTSFFGNMAASKAREHINSGPVILSDGGFRTELEPIVDVLDGQVNRFILFHVHRTATDFKRDSRGYVDLSDLGIPSFRLDNDGTVDSALARAAVVIARQVSA